MRVVDQFCGGEPKRTAVEDNIAVFARLRWRDRTRLSYACVQTIYATCDLEDYYLGDGDATCLRMDLDDTSLGDFLTHPLAHVHVDGNLSPRFALDGGDAGNGIVDFLEFVYRTYAPRKWIPWVKRVWAQEFGNGSPAGTIDPLPNILEAFAAGQFDFLRGCATDLTRIKVALRNYKDSMFNLHMDGLDRLLLEYPLAR